MLSLAPLLLSALFFLTALAAGPVHPGALSQQDCDITRQIAESLCTNNFAQRGFQGTYSNAEDGTKDRFLCGNAQSFGFLGTDKVGLYEVNLDGSHQGDVVLDTATCTSALQRSVDAFCQATMQGKFNPSSIQDIGNGLFATAVIYEADQTCSEGS